MNEETVEVPEKFQKLVSEVEQMSALDLAELVKVFEKKFGVSAAAPMMVAAPGGGGGVAEATAEEKTAFDVVLKEAGGQKIAGIKVVRELTGKGLKESKDIVDAPPQKVATGVTKGQAEEMKKKLEEAGATAEIA